MSLHAIGAAFRSWMSSVAEGIVAAADRTRSPRRVRLIEEGRDIFRVEGVGGRTSGASAERVRMCDGKFVGAVPTSVATMLKGSRIEFVLDPDRFLFRPLELPKRAAEFLDGIIRAQIDRLTPWAATDAAFGWTAPREVGNDRICLTIAATARALVVPCVQAAVHVGARIVVVSTTRSGPGPDAAAIEVLDHRAGGTLDAPWTRRVLTAVFAAAASSAVLAAGAAQVIGSDLDARQSDLLRRISQHRVAMRQDGSGTLPARQLLDRRKQGTAASVMVLEALSKSLPDHTYVTELRIDGDKLQIVGVTQDAPSLIRLMEQSPHFSRATFFAPTTRSPGDSGERFHIEARLNPVFTRT